MTRFVFVAGRPAPQGSHAYKGHRNGKPIITESSRHLGPWRDLIAWKARSRGGLLPVGPVGVRLDFVMPRPKQTPKRTPPAIKRTGDIDKLSRAALDAITGVWLEDDSLVTVLHASKRIAEPGEPSGVAITCTPITEGPTR